jgi:hypothetical protein
LTLTPDSFRKVSQGEDEHTAPVEPPLRRVIFGGVRHEDVAALQQRLAACEAQLRDTRAALEHTAGWARRLPLALDLMAHLACNEEHGEQDTPTFDRLAAAIHEVIGHHLLASVESAYSGDGDLASIRTELELSAHTDWDGPARPRSTEVRVGNRLLRCTWEPTALVGEDTVDVVIGLCRAALLTLVGIEGVGRRQQRSEVTQLADVAALVRHLVFRKRVGRPTRELSVQIDGGRANEYLELFGRVSVQATLADAAFALQEIAYACGGDAYQRGEWGFAALVDADRAEEARAAMEERLSEGELQFYITLND